MAGFLLLAGLLNAARHILIMWGDIVKIIVELEELQDVAARLEMYANLLDDYVPGYADEIKWAVADLREMEAAAEPVKGE